MSRKFTMRLKHPEKSKAERLELLNEALKLAEEALFEQNFAASGRVELSGLPGEFLVWGKFDGHWMLGIEEPFVKDHEITETKPVLQCSIEQRIAAAKSLAGLQLELEAAAQKHLGDIEEATQAALQFVEGLS